MQEKDKAQEVLSELSSGAVSIARLAEKYHQADIAAAINRIDDNELIIKILSELGNDIGSEVLTHLNEETREIILEKFSTEKLGDFIEEMSSDDAADILAEVEVERAEDILDNVSEEVEQDVQRLMEYPEDTAGGLMQTELVSSPGHFTVAEAIDNLKGMTEEIGDFHNIFVIDKDRKLTGVLPLQKLIISPNEARIDSLLEGQKPIAVTVDTDQEEVANIFMKYDLVSIPVVDGAGKLLGRIMFDDIADVLEEEADEDIMMMVGADDEALASTHSAIDTARYRFPWLGSSLLGGFITGALILNFKATLSEALALVAFIPVVMGISGNVGAQSSALVIRSLATGRLDAASLKGYIYKELKVGFLLGSGCGLLAGVGAYIWIGSGVLGFVVGVSIMISLVFAAIMGAVIPLVFKWLKVDPAIAGGPITLAMNDITGILIFFAMAAILLAGIGL
ncbi:Mg/Co/Ni transporter MgtE, CBS domain-containing [hydrothermal vent metagenome]|uniref:Mg/Co/Ni transporter MgtE, CBS domain-containing n=1 Tax=hydrothermal vent metagenome TaxID=652676 RepID=A0A3B1CCD4_9ZZZZ